MILSMSFSATFKTQQQSSRPICPHTYLVCSKRFIPTLFSKFKVRMTAVIPLSDPDRATVLQALYSVTFRHISAQDCSDWSARICLWCASLWPIWPKWTVWPSHVGPVWTVWILVHNVGVTTSILLETLEGFGLMPNLKKGKAEVVLSLRGTGFWTFCSGAHIRWFTKQEPDTSL